MNLPSPRHLLIALQIILGVTLIVGPFGWAVTPVLQDVNIGLGAGLALGLGIGLRLGVNSGASLGIMIGALIGMLTALIAGLIPGNGLAIIIPPVLALAVGLIDGLGLRRITSFKIAARLSFSLAVILGVGLFPGLHWGGFIGPLLVSPFVILFSGTMRYENEARKMRLHSPPWPLLLACLTVCVIMVLTLKFEENFAVSKAILFSLSMMLLSPLAFVQIGRWSARWLGPRLGLYRQLSRYLAVMWVPLGGFAVGYTILIIIFAGFYGTLYRLDPTAFSGIPPAVAIQDWLFFSFFTATAQDYNAMLPVSNAARLFAGSQIVLSIGWAVVVFAAVMTHIQPALQRLAEGE